jgi:hypothetical protein
MSLAIANVLIVFTLKMEVIHSSQTFICTRTARRHIPEDDIIVRHRRENLKSYVLCI